MLWCCLLLVFSAHAESPQDTLLSLVPHTEWLEDPDKLYRFENIHQIKDGWQPLEQAQQMPNKTAYWLKITLPETLPKPLESYILALGTSIDYATVLFPDGSTLQGGRLIPASEQSYKQSKAALLLIPKEKIRAGMTLFVQLEEDSGVRLTLAPVLHDRVYLERRVADEDQFRYTLQFAFQGSVWIMIAYSLAIFLIYLDRVYLYYAIYIFGISIFVAQSYGLLTEFLIGEFPEFDFTLRALGIHLAGIFYVAFMRAFLHLKEETPRVDQVMRAFVLVTVMSLFVSMVILHIGNNFRLYRMVSSAFFGLLYISIAIAGVAVWRRHSNSTLIKYFLGGTFSILLTGTIAVVITFVKGEASTGFWAQNGVIFEIIFFSLGLGYRMKSQEKEKRRMEAENARILREQNEVLEQRVDERTKEIMMKREEILTQNEELQQQQEEIITQRDYIESKNKELREQNRRITDSLRYAQTIQESILPTDRALDKAFADHFAIYSPKDIVSGDFYWHEAAAGYDFIAVVDCTGHGVPGAFMSMMGAILLNEIVIQEQIYEPTQILEELDKLLRYSMSQSRDGMDLVLCRLQKQPDGSTAIAYAGARRPLCYAPQAGQEVQMIRGTRRSIGGRKRKDRTFKQHKLELQAGARLYLYTDGYVDQHNMKGVKFGSVRFERLLNRISRKSLQEQGLELSNVMKIHQGIQQQRDDITVLALELD